MSTDDPSAKTWARVAKLLVPLFVVAAMCLIGSCEFLFDSGLGAHSILYDGNGNTGGLAPVDSATHLPGSMVAAAGHGDLENSGFAFRGWNTKRDASGISYSAGVMISMPSGDLRLYALWSRAIRRVSFDTRGGSSLEAISADILEEAPISSKSGFALEGWYGDPACSPGNRIAFPYAPAADTTLTALWIPASYGLNYRDSSQGYMVSKGSSSLDGTLIIPRSWLTRPVRAIAPYGFPDSSGIDAVELPHSVVSIGDRAFSECTGIGSIVLPAGLLSIGTGAFSGCSALGALALPASLAELGDEAFAYCNSLAAIDISEGIREVGAYLFADCESLSSVTIPGTVRSIGSWAFAQCYLLPSLVLPESVGSIGEFAFCNCSSLKSLVLPNGLETLADAVFIGCSSISEILIPGSVKSIGDSAFYRCIALKNLALPEGLLSIGIQAFGRCGSLTGLTIPASLSSIGEAAFVNCQKLEEVIVRATTPPAAGTKLFLSCHALSAIRVPSGSVAAYKAAAGWSEYAGFIIAE
jgi:hypothetical protein